MQKPRIAIIILAAGSSKRLGSPKQLLPYKNTSLLQHVARIALQVNAQKVYVVVGCNAEEIQDEIAGLEVERVLNSDWKTGLSSSLRAGLKTLSVDIEAAMILLCDQPKITSPFLNSLVESYISVRPKIVASRYGNTVGVPALFDRSVFPEILALQGDIGAKRIIENHGSDRIEIDFPGGEYDIDTIHDIADM